MFKLNSLKNRIRGWLPKEYGIPNSTSTKMVESNLKPKKWTKTRFALLAIVVFAGSMGLYSLLQVVGLESYDGSAAAALVFIIVVYSVWSSKVSQKIQSFMLKDEAIAKIVKVTFHKIVIANAVISALFLATFFLIDPMINNDAITLGSLIAIIALWILANRFLSRDYRKLTKAIEEGKP